MYQQVHVNTAKKRATRQECEWHPRTATTNLQRQKYRRETLSSTTLGPVRANVGVFSIYGAISHPGLYLEFRERQELLQTGTARAYVLRVTRIADKMMRYVRVNI